MDRVDLMILVTLFVGGYAEHGTLHGAIKWFSPTLWLYTAMAILSLIFNHKADREEKEESYIKNMIKREPIETVIKFVQLSRKQRDLIIYNGE
jgi:hypothetical protein